MAASAFDVDPAVPAPSRAERAAADGTTTGGPAPTSEWPLRTERLSYTPLSVSDAQEMQGVLDDIRLHEFVGGVPSVLKALQSRYRRLEAGSRWPSERWVNWIVRRRADDRAVGTVQATVVETPNEQRAEIAWTVGIPYQHQGYASEAAGALVDWLGREGISRVQAHIHPEHHASMGVARHLGMERTEVREDGETVWELRGATGAADPRALGRPRRSDAARRLSAWRGARRSRPPSTREGRR